MPPPIILPMAPAGGFNTASGPHAMLQPGPDGIFRIPWLTVMENGVYGLDGWPRKMAGAAKVNTVTTGATDSVMGIFDYWRQGTTGAPVQKRLIYAGDNIFKDDADGTWDSLASGLDLNKPAAASIFNDEIILSTTSVTDVPRVYDQSAIANLGGTPPDFAFSVSHKQRVFASGNQAVPSRVYFTVLGSHEDWVGAGSGSFDVFNDDGDRSTGLASHQDELVILKGPYHGSIFRLIGSAPTGSEAYQLLPLIRGIGGTSHASIIAVGNDLTWWDHNGIHSLLATARFGNYAPAFLSHEIASFFKADLNHTRLEFVQGVNDAARGRALWTVSTAGATTNDRILGIDYRFQPARFFLWPAYAVASLGMVLDGTNGLIPWAGTYTGFVYRTEQSDRNIADTGYTFRARTPFLKVADPFYDEGIARVHVAFVPQGESQFTFAYTRDSHPTQEVAIPQSAGGSAALDAFTLDTDTLAGENFDIQFRDLEGSFKTLAWEISQGGLNEDCEPHGLSLAITPQGEGHTGLPG